MSTATLQAPSKVITGFTDSTPLLSAPDKLRARADEEGFLFFKRLLPKDLLLELRGQILEIIDRQGWLKKGTDRMDGIGDLAAIARDDSRDPKWKYIGVSEKAYGEVQSLELFHALQHHPKLIALYEKLFRAGVIPHPRAIARVLLPAPSLAPTPPHQDYIYIQGTHSFWTCWFPLGDCPMELGGLSVLRGSHREKVLDVSRAPGAGGFESHLCGLDYAWVQGDYECGDIITFPSHMVHKALPNQRRDRIRLSCDYRFQSIEEEIDPSSLIPHMATLQWDELYRGWKNEKLKYYWKSYSLKTSVWDPSFRLTKEKIC
jgi:hypothetical protein